MFGSTLREQAGTSVREPSISTTHTRHTFTGVRLSRKQSVGVSMPSLRGCVENRRAFGTETGWPSMVISIVRRSRGGGACGTGPRGIGCGGGAPIHAVACRLAPLLHANRFHRCKADSSALAAVWPRPQIEASRMACAISFSMTISCAAEPSGRLSTSRCNASCWRTTPMRQGTHWPQVSWRKNAGDAHENQASDQCCHQTASPRPIPAWRRWRVCPQR